MAHDKIAILRYNAAPRYLSACLDDVCSCLHVCHITRVLYIGSVNFVRPIDVVKAEVDPKLEERFEQESEAPNLTIILRPSSQLWSWVFACDRMNEIASRSVRSFLRRVAGLSLTERVRSSE